MTTHKVYVDTESLSREELEQLLIDKDQENKKLKVENQELKNKYDDLKELCEKIGEYNKNLMHEVNLCYRSLYK